MSAGASQRVTRPRGEARGKVSTTPCHRQTDDTSTGLRAEDPAVIITHANTHIIMRTHTNTHTHTLLTNRVRKVAGLLNLLLNVFFLFVSF